MPRKTTSFPCACICFHVRSSSGSSSLQGTHHEAQKFKTIALPLKSESESVLFPAAGSSRDRREYIQQVVLPVSHIDLAGGSVIVHRAELSPTQQGACYSSRIQTNGDDAALACRHIGGKAARNADILRPTGDRHSAKQMPVHFIHPQRGASGNPELIGCQGCGIRRGR